MYHIAVVEDDVQIQHLLAGYIEKFAQESGEVFEVQLFSDGDEIASDYKADYDIIFLDIQMKRFDGMKTAEYIRRLDSDVILIFVTNMVNFAVQAYSVNAFDYILKPVQYFAFSQQLQKAVAQLRMRSTKYIMIALDGGTLRLNAADILFIDCAEHKLTLHTHNKGDHVMKGTVTAMEEQLADYGFCRCNSGYLVNLAHVSNVRHNVVVVGKYELQLSRARKKPFMEALANHIGAVMK